MNTANAPEGGLSGTSQDLVILSSAMYEASGGQKNCQNSHWSGIDVLYVILRGKGTVRIVRNRVVLDNFFVHRLEASRAKKKTVLPAAGSMTARW